MLRVPVRNAPPIQYDDSGTTTGRDLLSPRKLTNDKVLYDVTSNTLLGRIVSDKVSDTKRRFVTNTDIAVETRDQGGRMVAVRARLGKTALYGHVIDIRSEFD